MDFSESQQEIINYLTLQNNPHKEQIIFDLLSHGRRVFCTKYKNKLPADILSKVSDKKFLELMKQDIRETWDVKFLAADEPKIREFYKRIEEENQDRLNDMLTRLAENGNPHTKSSSQTLFIMLELAFPWISHEKNVADNLWIHLTTDGLRSLEQFSDDIPPEELDEHLDEHDKSALYFALSHYYKDELEELFKKHLQNIETKSICDVAIDSLTRNGWLAGIEVLLQKIPPRHYKPFHKAISDMVQEQKSKIITTSPNDSRSSSTLKPPLSTVSISQRISDYLQLNNEPKRNEIISSMCTHGRRALFQYEDDLIPDLFSIEQKYVQGQPDTLLLKLLQEHVYEDLKSALEQGQPALFALIQREKEKNACQFSAVERRLAEYGTSYTESSLVLFFILQLLFDGVNEDGNGNSINTFRKLFERVTDEGIKGTKEFEQYIAKDDLHDQLTDKESLLHSALRMYFNEEVQQLFNEHGISNTKNLYDFVVGNLVKDGWICTIESESVKNKIAEAKFEKLRAAIYKKTGRSITVELLQNPATRGCLKDCFKSSFNNVTIATSRDSLSVSNQDTAVTATICEPEIINYQSNELEKGVKSGHDLVNTSDEILTDDEASAEFSPISKDRMLYIEDTIAPDSLLNESIEHVLQKYQRIQTTISLDDIADKATGFLQTWTNLSSANNMEIIEDWKISLISDITNLAGNCVMETDDISSSSSSSSDWSILDHYVSFDPAKLKVDNSKTKTDLKDEIKCGICVETIDDPLKPSNRLRLHQVTEEISDQLLILVTDAPSLVGQTGVLYEQIIQYINRTISKVNRELNVFHLKISPSFSCVIHSNAVLLLIIFYYQERKAKFHKKRKDV